MLSPLLSKIRGEDKQHIIDTHPMNRLGKADEIADGFMFLASNQSSFISGTTIEIDGGYLSK